MFFRPDSPNLILVGNQGIQVSLDAGFLPETMTLVAAMSSTPDMNRQGLIDKTIGDLRTAGIWSLLDEVWFMAAHSSQAAKLGWKRFKDLTEVNSPTFTTDRGFAGNGTSSYLNTNYTPSTDAVHYALNDASLGIYSRTNSAPADSTDIGANNGATLYAHVTSRLTSDISRFRVNQVFPTDTHPTVTDSRGLFAARRTASNVLNAWRNGALIANMTAASTGLPNRSFFIGAVDTAGSAGSWSAREYAFAFVGASLSTQQQADLYTLVQAYMTAVGAQV